MSRKLKQQVNLVYRLAVYFSGQSLPSKEEGSQVDHLGDLPRSQYRSTYQR